MTSLFLAFLPLFYYINSPVIEMREQPNQESEIVSQAYFAEGIKVLEEAHDWIKIETTVDHYKGWIKKGSLCQRQDSFLSNSSTTFAKVNRCAAHLYSVQDTVYGPILTLPFESKLEVLEPKEESNSRWIKVSLVDGREGYIQRGDVAVNPTFVGREQMCNLSLQFLGLPYTWGGRSSFGYDCSGFVQMLYRQMGIYLPRDTKDQINWKGLTAISVEELSPGDLIFFGLAEDKIRHVGLYLGNNQFIHATVAENLPYIRISKLSDPEWNGSGRFIYRAARKLKVMSED
ncbi:SH3 domain-containing C40 family peptidase [Parachlamydia sp. AcF125]|uniref:C40 family peptidase n=1 Tax=Parachlamydia sp. AcF125 TaxID=2795736 RepID=UPI001BC938A9|nr:SH3 domain-containing C40 family peptidase [Parachlamydia sp. AcF125]MBS4168332.1 Gamma-D-glutamyl-L-lysine dipeptidyl-peptidase [Parachlamydia sp. AcF125]